jgi:hypothetical protein
MHCIVAYSRAPTLEKWRQKLVEKNKAIDWQQEKLFKIDKADNL